MRKKKPWRIHQPNRPFADDATAVSQRQSERCYGSITVWIIDLKRLLAVERAEKVLPPEELRRASRFRDPVLRAEYIRAHVALREILGFALRTSASDVSIVRGQCARCGRAHGKPELIADHGTQFNLSRTAGAALVAVGEGFPVGIDVESLDRARELLEIEALICGPGDDLPQRLRDSERGEELLRLWTRKEAVVKALGVGLTLPLSRFTVGRPATGWRPVSGGALAYVLDLPLEDRTYAAALAVVGFTPPVILSPWPPRGSRGPE